MKIQISIWDENSIIDHGRAQISAQEFQLPPDEIAVKIIAPIIAVMQERRRAIDKGLAEFHERIEADLGS